MKAFRTMAAATMVAMTLAAGATLPAAGQDARALFQRALVAERAGGDLDAATALYQQVVRVAGSDREIVARALLQLAGIEERQGKAEAKRSYEAIAAGFADQAEVAAAASARAEALGAAAELAPPAEVSGAPVKRPFPLWAGVVSPNGRYVATSNPNEPERWSDPARGLFVRDLQTGVVRQLDGQDYSQETLPRLGVYENYVWSPDSTRIAYSRRVNVEEGATGRRFEIRIAAIDGGQPRVLVPAGRSAIWTLDWSADGRQILASLRNNDPQVGRQPPVLALIAVADGSIRPLRAASGHGIGFCYSTSGLSPDGRLAAYTIGAPAAGPGAGGAMSTADCDIYVAPTDGGDERPLIAHPAHDQFVAWTPRGNLLFLSDRGGTMDLWLATVEEGQAVGLPTRVGRDAGHLYAMGFTRQGALYFLGPGHMRNINPGSTVLNQIEHDVLQAQLDPSTGRLVGPGSPVSPGAPGWASAPSWSADGRFLAYRTRHPRARYWNGISVLSVATGATRNVTPDIPASLAEQQVFVEPGGKTAIAATQSPHSTLYRIDLDTGAATALGSIGVEMVLLPDVKAVAYIATPDRRTVVVRALADGQERTVFEAPEEARVSSLAVSADGTQFTVRQNTQDLTRIMVAPMAGGDAHEVYQSRASGGAQKSTWSPEGRYIYFIERPEQNLPSEEMFRVPVAGGRAEPVGLKTDGTTIWNLSIDPSGRFITFGQELIGQPREWVLENFLPAHELVPRPVRR